MLRLMLYILVNFINVKEKEKNSNELGKDIKINVRGRH